MLHAELLEVLHRRATRYSDLQVCSWTAGCHSCSSCTDRTLMCRGQAVALDLLRGVAYLHQQQILHLDIKSGPHASTVAAAASAFAQCLIHGLSCCAGNILLTQEGRAKVADAGLGACSSLSGCPAAEVWDLHSLSPWCSCGNDGRDPQKPAVCLRLCIACWEMQLTTRIVRM